MKKSLIAAAIAFGCITQTQAGIPVSVVLDATAQINQVQNFAQMLKEYATLLDQLDQMKRQFEQMEREYSSVTGSRNLGDILNDPEFKHYLPDNWQDVYQGIRNNGYEGLSGSAKALRDASKVFDACEYITDPTEKRVCNAQAVKPAQDQAFANDAYKKSQNRVNQIESLMREINRTNDPKAIAELSARIQAEQAMIQNEQTKLSLYQASAEAEERLLEQQKLETTKKLIKSTNYGRPVQPVEF
ncbi:P-type DNA transfer protein VirB5 [Vibrio parahaemolyticus]|uniref:P-type DNA transfer protein VirB5 n=1 Tax=Vibrio parahaemolyticus TaxID=670 RepID=UPI0007B6D492|nr:P-type DNA transfer protein VirB5 [Vibrio parahaemolyticus]ANC00451.1 Type IV secretion system protein virB5 precursor [Vibrio parahaemolyticus]ELA7420691.1 P-type DNA transfer protein VirB5 [Vibrio parahaemolyticus]MBE5155597.1 P-type DNA transfer protein VirB5 [Vibrio parahaemolyticus]MBE5164922.1 P-type DNA transfer protein VirB5 [Vibrio parahaemolyticus]